ncbi:MAG: hypothetical protein V3S25_12375 [Nitrospirales bacterium]|jgi:hypothetical protein
MSYEHFLKERQRIVDARQRVQQRTDQLVTTGAAGALVLSITFLEKIAPSPLVSSRPLLIWAWVLLLLALLANLSASFASQKAFDDFLDAFDQSFTEQRSFHQTGKSHHVATWLSRAGAVAFVLGVATLALFGLINAPFQR